MLIWNSVFRSCCADHCNAVLGVMSSLFRQVEHGREWRCLCMYEAGVCTGMLLCLCFFLLAASCRASPSNMHTRTQTHTHTRTHTHTHTHIQRIQWSLTTSLKILLSFVGRDLWHYQWARSYLWILCPWMFGICWMTRPIWCDTVAEPLAAVIILRPTEWLSRGEQLLRSHAVTVPFHLAAQLTSEPLSSNHTGIL